MILWRNLILGIAIFILTIFVGIYGINTFYGKAPEFNDYCPMAAPQNPSECVKQNGTWINYNDERAVPSAKVPVPATTPTGYCDVYTYCQKQLEKAEEPYYKGVFLIALPLGIIIIAIGLFVFSLEAVGLGLMSGGVGIIIYGVQQYWRFQTDLIRFVLLLVGLIIIICLTYYFNKKLNLKLFGKREKKE